MRVQYNDTAQVLRNNAIQQTSISKFTRLKPKRNPITEEGVGKTSCVVCVFGAPVRINLDESDSGEIAYQVLDTFLATVSEPSH